MDALQMYLRQTLGQEIGTADLPASQLDRLPSYLRGTFTLKRMRYLGIDCVLAMTGNQIPMPTIQLTKQLQRLREEVNLVTILVAGRITPAQRKSLIGRRINFIVPGRQLFLPDLMIDLQERYRSQPVRGKLLPSSQVILFSWILRRHESIERMTFAQIARALDYTPMAIGMAAANLLELDLCTIVGNKGKRLNFPSSREALWNRAQPFLTNPVKKVLHEGPCPRVQAMFKANVSALSEYTNIDEGGERYYAIAARTYQQESKKSDTPRQAVLEESQHLELWKYDPGILTGKQTAPRSVDPLSLFVSLKGNADERIIKALQVLLGGVQW